MDNNRIHSLILSLFCTTIFGSAYVSAIDGVALAGVGAGLSEKIQSQISAQLQDINGSGWAVSNAGLAPAPAEVSGRAVGVRAGPAGQEKKAESPWPGIVDKIYAEVEKDIAMSGKLCTFLGFSADNKSVGFRQIEGKYIEGFKHDINVRKLDAGDVGIFFMVMAEDRKEWIAFRMSAAGELERAAYFKRGGTTSTIVTEKPFPAGFEKERDRWLEYFGKAVASK